MVADYPITPSAELLQQLDEELANYHGPPTKATLARAYQVGADQELEACCFWVDREQPGMGPDLKNYRRPMLISLKQQALHLLEREIGMDEKSLNIVRKALETIEDE